jgi:hypothetical protein
MKLKSILAIMLAISSIFASAGERDMGLSFRPVIGIGKKQTGGVYGVGKVYILDMGKGITNSGVTVNAFGVGYGVGKESGLVLSPAMIKFHDVGISIDVFPKQNALIGWSLNYEF